MIRTSTLAIGAAALALSTVGGAAFAQQNVEHRFSSDEFEALSAKMKDGLLSVQIPVGPGVPVFSVRRANDGEVELHIKLADIITARKGSAQIRIGGKAEGQRQTGPDEFRGGKQVGGKIYDLKPGDVVYVPPNTPHQMLVKKGTEFRYMAIKFGPMP